MGRFDGPNFYKEDIGIVSIWVSKVPEIEIPKNYFDENYSEDEEEPFNQFSSDFGFGFYDHDFAENAGVYGETVEEKLKSASYGKSFYKEASANCKNSFADAFYLIYDFVYDPKVTNITESKYYIFLGSFPYDKNS